MNSFESAIQQKISSPLLFLSAVREITQFSCTLSEFLSDFMIDFQEFTNVSDLEAVVKEMCQKSYIQCLKPF